ncbi:uncharacterized protein Z519_06293 [Cladophialophora bantiana CBS 173.52]|uniref:DUF1398 domain-containing protein n=1 Tax=Cladophialophora bantiana (strain ATCC 10958 / CBS 173.52 / CDC B-1940 / NIH 8579) TaxID=1442370 RepID=A0A0D2ERF1_CLAB1|nr:uncharacterized protein Z519_06293 [Cladophialophora bantiana CBS 173.52]KIW92446.1 hypothetical protein Z519_06293 [Cladophialophora bantiana CBS 173.52]
MTLTPIQQVFAQVHSPTSLTFPETIALLLNLGVTRYHVDYISRTTTTYTPRPASKSAADSTSPSAATSTGQTPIATEQMAMPAPAVNPDTSWDAAALARAIRRVQGRQTVYAEFVRECVDAGVAGYIACLVGKRVLYYGLNGDVHVEWFPGAEPMGHK